MITEDYVSFEVAKLLKERGFNEPIWTRYEDDNKVIFGDKYNWNNSPMGHTSAPTHQMAMKWLREEHELLISVDASPIYGKVKDEKGRNTCGLLYWHYMASGEWMNDKYNPQQRAFVVSGKSYEEAVGAACLYALKNLI